MPPAVSVHAMSSVPYTRRRISAAAPALMVRPQVKSGYAGVTINDSQFGSAAVAGLPAVSAARIAVMGRQKLYVYLVSYTAAELSESATLSRANNLALCQRS